MEFSEIRQVVERALTKDFKGYAVVSNLNWLRYQKQLAEITKLIPRNSKVLDIGCGVGTTSAVIKLVKPDADVIGIDIEKRPTWEDYQKQYNVKYFIDDALSLKFKKDEFDVVVSFGVIEHVTDDKKFIAENLRILKRRGFGVILNIPNKYSINEFLARKLSQYHHERKYNMPEIKSLLISAGIRNFTIKRRFLIPAQVNRVSSFLGKTFNIFYSELDFIDRLLCKSPLNMLAQVYDVFYRKD